ncbi:MAG: hypothetical protein WEC41_04890 [Dongiaceae bacterium]
MTPQAAPGGRIPEGRAAAHGRSRSLALSVEQSPGGDPESTDRDAKDFDHPTLSRTGTNLASTVPGGQR